VVGATRGKPAVTRYKVERAFSDVAALIECRLLTGRTHQIRVHLAERGHPLIGDPVYSGRHGRTRARQGTAAAVAAYFPRQALHARHLGFSHPASGEYLAFDSDLPDDMKSLLGSLEGL
jgi:23S rRNA pseudouridine1911/1915/1917 synthase